MGAIQLPADRSDADEAALLERVRAGDHDAFARVMRRYNQRVFRIARAILPDDAEAEDAAQEAWVLAYRHLHQFEGRSRFGSWVGRIVAREALARAGRRGLVLVENLEEQSMDRTSADPEQLASRGEARVSLEQAIDALPGAFRTVFVLRAVEELSVAETAECLGIGEETVKTRLHRARRMLREHLQQEMDVGAGDAFAFAGDRCDRIVAAVLARLG